MNDNMYIDELIAHLKELFIKARIKCQYWNKKYMTSRSPGHWGDGTYWSKADKHYQLGLKLQKIIDRLISIKNKIKATSVADTIFNRGYLNG